MVLLCLKLHMSIDLKTLGKIDLQGLAKHGLDELCKIKLNGKEIFITSPEITEDFDALVKMHSTPKMNTTLFEDSRLLFEDLLGAGVSPVFTVPRAYANNILQNGLVPYETDIKGVFLLAGTLGRPPFTRDNEKRYIVILREPQKALKYGIQPRFAGTPPCFRGIVATLRNIPLNELLIIDSETMQAVHKEDLDEIELEFSSVPIDLVNNEISKISFSTKAEFSSQMSESMILERGKLNEILENNYSPENLVKLFEMDFPEIYSKVVEKHGDRFGNMENETLRSHTIRTLKQFDKFFSKTKLPMGVSVDLFRVILAIHDIGKIEAIQKGDKTLQHEFTVPMIKVILTRLKFSLEEIQIATTLLKADLIGKLFKSKKTFLCFKSIIDLSKDEKSKKDIFLASELFELFQVLYFADASSYTKNAGNFENLDHIFQIYTDRKGQEHISFTSEYENLINEVEDNIYEYEDGENRMLA